MLVVNVPMAWAKPRPCFTPCLVNVPMAWAKPRPTAWIASEALVSTPWVALAKDSTRLASLVSHRTSN